MNNQVALFKCLFKCDIKQLNEPCGIWIYGEPGSGKDFCVYKLCGSDLYVKNINKWWDGYKNEKFVLISDVEPCHKENMGYFLKIWCDRYPFLAEVKGSSMRIRPKAIVVTSNYKIEQIWAGNLFVAIWRRFHKIYKIEDKIEVYKREIHKPSDQYVRHLRELINLSDNVVQEENVLSEAPELVQGTSKRPTEAERDQRLLPLIRNYYFYNWFIFPEIA